MQHLGGLMQHLGGLLSIILVMFYVSLSLFLYFFSIVCYCCFFLCVLVYFMDSFPSDSCSNDVRGDIDYLLNNSVTMSNIIARASQDLLLSEKRIISLAQSFFDSRRSASDFLSSPSRTVVVSVSDYSEVSNSVSHKSLYRILLAASKSLFDRYVEFQRPFFSGVRCVRFRWLESISYIDDSGSVELCFSRRVFPLLVGLTDQFTTYKLEHIVSFRSIYSVRLYEFLLSYVDSSSDFSHFVINFDDLRFALQVPDSYRFNNFRSRVLDSGIDDICLAVPWTIDYKLIKTGRRVTALDFSVRRLELPLDVSASDVDDDFSC